MNYLSSAALAGIPDARVTPPAATGLHTFVAADYATRVQSRADECLTKKEITRTGLSLKDHPIHVALDEDGWTLTCVDPRQAYPQEAIGGRGDIEPWKEFYDANLRGFDLSGLQLDNYVDLGEADLRGADLRGTSLRGAKLRNAVIRISRDDTPTRLEGADFTKADVSYIHWSHTDFRETIFTGASLRWSYFNRSDFSGVDMAGAIFDWTRCENTDFSKANLAGARFFHSSDLKGAKFILANLAGATFSHVKLEEVDFTGARLVGTIFEYTDLSSAKIPFATMLAAVEGGTQFEQVEFGAWNRLKYTGAHTVSAAKKLWNKTNTYLETVDA